TGAGWQPYILPHYPSTLVPFTWETQNPGQGRRSLRIDSAFGLSSFPVAAKPETPMIFSFLARAEHPGDTLGIAWGTVGPGPQAWATIRPGGAWTRHKVAVTAMKGADNIIFFLTNENPPEAGHAIFIDALCLTPGEARNAAAAEYHTPPYSLGLSTQSPDNCFLSAQPVPVTATLEFLQKTDTGNNAGNNTGTDAGRARTEGWTWIVSEVAPRERELFRKPVVWNDGYATSPAISSAPVPAVAQEDKNILRAHCEVPPGQGIYRVVIVPPSITSTAAPASLPAPASASAPMPAPTHELLVVQAGFEGLPEISADPEKAFLGIHAANDWTLLRGTRQHYVNLQPGEDHRLARLHHFGARWLRLHGGRPDLTKLNAVLPDGPDAPVLYREDIARWKNVGFNILGLLEVEWKKKHNGEPWFPAHASRGGAWMSTLLPDDLSVWEHYTRTVVRGYAGLISDWEVYNEPNGQMSVDDYLPMLAAANRVAKETDPKARVMGICSTSDHGADFSTFLRQALERGAGAHLDIVSFHPYARSPEREGSQMLRQVNEQASLHTEGKPVWITEVGRMTSAAYRSHASRMDPAKALPSIEGAGWVARYMIEARRAGVARYFSYSTAQPLFAWQPWEWCPLFEYDGTPAPMFLVAGTAARLLGGARFIGEAGAGGDASGAVRAYVFERDEPVAMRFAAIWVPDETAHGRYEVTFAPSGASSLSSRPSPPPLLRRRGMAWAVSVRRTSLSGSRNYRFT
ncbi:MAG: hypothetical protein LBK99_20590, partial [Opitutaceae bacterium]|nr:hypothetical protein [Opitutaceae bacterium]